jgi:hypothetical protein
VNLGGDDQNGHSQHTDAGAASSELEAAVPEQEAPSTPTTTEAGNKAGAPKPLGSGPGRQSGHHARADRVPPRRAPTRGRPRPVRVDQAALMGAALAAIVAFVVSPGEFEPLASVLGATLLLVIFAYYRFRPWPKGRLEALRRGMALAAVSSLCACLLLAWPVQRVIDASPDEFNICKATYDVHVVESPSPEKGVVVSGNYPRPGDVADAYFSCLGGRATRRLALLWVGFTLLGTLAYLGGRLRFPNPVRRQFLPRPGHLATRHPLRPDRLTH